MAMEDGTLVTDVGETYKEVKGNECFLTYTNTIYPDESSSFSGDSDEEEDSEDSDSEDSESSEEDSEDSESGDDTDHM